MKRIKNRLLLTVELFSFGVATVLMLSSVAWLQPVKSINNVIKTAFPFLLVTYFCIFLSFKILEYYYFRLLNQKKLLEKLNANLVILSSNLKIHSFFQSSLEILIDFCKGNRGILLILDEKLKRHMPDEILAINTSLLEANRRNSNESYRMLTFSSGNIPCEVERRIKELIKQYSFENSNSVMVIPLSGNNGIRAIAIVGIPASRKEAVKIFEDVQDIMDVFIKQLNIGLENSILHEEVKQASIKDPLTSLYNRRFFNLRKKEEFSKAKRMGFPISIMISDFDNFKNYIDTYGHPKGDVLLAEAAKIITATLRETDIACRFGGDEFAYLLPFTSSIEARTVAERVKKAVSQFPFLKEINKNPVNLTLSIGIASFPEHGQTEEDILAKADHSLFLSKDNGKNTITVYKE
ncbi:MAG TPA: diguanylate cyclase [bacterium]|nr:diguanylate cyclase [bacterium]